ncbi:MAG: hypothetical protein P4L10_06425 [Acidobacteriaceae bacterium]|nr:hypothetical protein [Acidobacteriaceae bacterium]
MYEKVLITVEDQQSFGEVHAAIAHAFSSGAVQGFLKSIYRAGLRIRNFEGILRQGILGAPVAAAYNQLGNADQGQIREFYLASVETVSSDLRAKYLKLYAPY